MVWLLFFFVLGGVVAVFVWDYRRKAARRDRASQERFKEMFKAKATPTPGPTAMAPAVPAAESAVPTPSIATAATTASFRARERFLAQPATLIYLLLKASIPDHEIFANVSLAALIDAPGKGYEREQQVRRLSQYQFDFVVCDKNMRVVAAIDLERAGDAVTGGERRFMEECCKTGGIRLIRMDPLALPRRDSVRALVCGVQGKPQL